MCIFLKAGAHVASLAVEGSPTAPPAVQIPSDGPHRTTVAFKRLGPPFPFRVSSPYFISPVARLSPPLLLFFLAGSCLCLTPAASGEAARPRPSGGRAPAVLRFVSRWFIPRSVRASLSHPAAVGMEESLVLGPTRAFLNGVVGCGSLSFSLR